jgi:adenosylhomocysteinase
MNYDIKDKQLRHKGRKRIEWALPRMPVLALLRREAQKNKPLKGLKIGACLHVTTETAVLGISLKDAGAEIYLCASNPLSTQDDVAASLVLDYHIPVFAIKGEDTRTYYRHILSVLGSNPNLTMDDGADLVAMIHKNPQRFNMPLGGTEETTTGVIRLKALERQQRLLYPIVAVNDALTKHLFDNRYGTGQSTLDGIVRATNKLIAGSNFVICGYGWCGKGVAMRARGLGANVIICEVDSLKALEAVMDGFRVMPMKDAAPIGDIFVTVTGDISVIRKEHFASMKDGALVCNSGHFNVELDLKQLEQMKSAKREAREFVAEYTLKRGGRSKKISVLADGRLVNLACAEGHPAEVMDLSFANQFLSCRYLKENRPHLEKKVYKIPDDIDSHIARLKLKSLGINIDELTPAQKKYLSSWQEGT